MEALSVNTSRSQLGKPAGNLNQAVPRSRIHTDKKRHPLSDATNRVNNGVSAMPPPPSLPHHSSLDPDGNLQKLNHPPFQQSKVEGQRVSAISREDNNRNSQISTTSTNASTHGRRKTHVGPWCLGKTIGKGASGRVRKARHAATGQNAAVKIVSKKAAKVCKSSSLLSIEQSPGDGRKPIPFGIEREVVIMKMIEHPNIIRLFDIWENRGEL